jgi:TnpA family transposase
MPRRSILTARQRAALFDLPTDEANILYHYTLSAEDLEHIDDRRRPENRFGYALQLCVLRYPGRLISSREMIPESVVRFIGAQLGMTGDEILPYAARRQTRQQHLQALRQVYGFKMFSGHRARELKKWLASEAENATSNHDLVRRFVDECRRTRTILPGISVIERLCADALVAAERRIDSAIARQSE